MPVSYVGVDVSKATLDVFIEVNSKPKHRQFVNSECGYKDMLIWLRRWVMEDIHICMEATGSYWEKFAAHVFNAGLAVSVVNPSCIKRFGQSELKRTKTDKVDAGVIFRFARAMNPEVWVPPSPELQLLQALSRRVNSLTKMRRQELNRHEAESEKIVKSSIASVVKRIEAEIVKVKKKIKELLTTNEYLRTKHQLLLSIPAIGEETAHMILAEVPNLDLFTDAKQLVAFAGLAPREIRSGSSVRGRTALSKTGNSRLRRGLYMCAVVAMKWNPIVAAFSDRLLKRGKPQMKVVGASMRKLLHIVYGVLKSGKPFCASVGLS